MGGEEAIVGVVFFAGLFTVLRPLVGALSKRIGGEVPKRQEPAIDDSVLAELQQLRAEVNDLNERMDFAERMLAKQKSAERIAPPPGG